MADNENPVPSVPESAPAPVTSTASGPPPTSSVEAGGAAPQPAEQPSAPEVPMPAVTTDPVSSTSAAVAPQAPSEALSTASVATAQAGEQKPAETQPAEAQPAEVKPEAQPPTAQPAEEQKPAASPAEPAAEQKPAEAQPPAAQPPTDEQKAETAAPPAQTTEAGAPAPQPPAADAQTTDESAKQELTMPHVKYAQNSLRSLKSRREAAAFLQPVDPIALRIPHYTQIIHHPMDLGTIDQKLALTAHRLKGPAQNRMSDKLKHAVESGRINPEKDFYTRIEDFEKDLFLVFDNCRTFNGAEHIFTKNAEVLRGVYEKQRSGLRNAAAVARETGTPDGKARRSSNAVPTIRRSSSNGGRPKREIHPPPSRDLPWTEENLHPASKRAISNRRGKNGEPLTPREQAYWSKVINDELKFCYRVVDDLLKPAHQDLAWVFYEIPAKDFDWAPAYFATIKKPIALLPIQRKLKSGAYADLAAFDSDMQLMFRNCFTFNPPDSDVYVMGQRLKDVYESKMQKKPVPPPLEPESEEESEIGGDSDEEDEVADDNAALVQQLQRQISELQDTLEGLENSKTKNPVLITSTRVALNSVQAALAGAMSVGASLGKSKKAGKKRSSSSLEKKRRDDGSRRKGKSPSSKRPRTMNGSPARKGKRGAGSDEEDVRTVTFDQKEELAAKITELSDERLDGAIRIINEDKPPGSQDNEEEIELDIDELSPQTLYKLYKYVVRPKKSSAAPAAEGAADGKPAIAPAPIDGRKRGTGGLKKKNLDETEEAERIARLQQQLQQFNDPNAASSGTPAPAADPGAGGKHDDLVQSESSSGEEEEESESESEVD